jgi:cold shock CspA family protein
MEFVRIAYPRNCAKGRDKMKGIVKFFKDREGYGFITPDGPPGQSDIYVHRSALQWTNIPKLEAGMRVEFQVRKSLRNDREAASELRIIHEAAA